MRNQTKIIRMLPAMAVMAAALVLFAGGHAKAEGVKTGDPAPNFTLTGADGDTYTLEQYKGQQPVVLEWTNHGCPYVQKHYNSGNMQSLQEKAVQDGVAWFTIVSSAPGYQGHTTPEEALQLINKAGSHETARLFDPTGKVGRLYDAKTTPHMFVIDKDGTVVYQGAIDSIPTARIQDIEKAENYVETALAALKNGTAIEKGTTKPYGCGVKYGH